MTSCLMRTRYLHGEDCFGDKKNALSGFEKKKTKHKTQNTKTKTKHKRSSLGKKRWCWISNRNHQFYSLIWVSWNKIIETKLNLKGNIIVITTVPSADVSTICIIDTTSTTTTIATVSSINSILGGNFLKVPTIIEQIYE